MMEPKYIIFDTETGGTELKHSLLTAYFSITDVDLMELAKLSLAVKPDDGNYVVCGEALAVNKIDLVKHTEIAIPYKKAGTILYDFLKSTTSDGKLKLVAVGQNVGFDIQMVIDKLISCNSWGQFVSRRNLCLSAVSQYFISVGKLPPELGSLVSIAQHFGIPVDDAKTHGAEYDVYLSKEVFSKLRNMG